MNRGRRGALNRGNYANRPGPGRGRGSGRGRGGPSQHWGYHPVNAGAGDHGRKTLGNMSEGSISETLDHQRQDRNQSSTKEMSPDVGKLEPVENLPEVVGFSSSASASAKGFSSSSAQSDLRNKRFSTWRALNGKMLSAQMGNCNSLASDSQLVHDHRRQDCNQSSTKEMSPDLGKLELVEDLPEVVGFSSSASASAKGFSSSSAQSDIRNKGFSTWRALDGKLLSAQMGSCNSLASDSRPLHDHQRQDCNQSSTKEMSPDLGKLEPVEDLPEVVGFSSSASASAKGFSSSSAQSDLRNKRFSTWRALNGKMLSAQMGSCNSLASDSQLVHDHWRQDCNQSSTKEMSPDLGKLELVEDLPEVVGFSSSASLSAKGFSSSSAQSDIRNKGFSTWRALDGKLLSAQMGSCNSLASDSRPLHDHQRQDCNQSSTKEMSPDLGKLEPVEDLPEVGVLSSSASAKGISSSSAQSDLRNKGFSTWRVLNGKMLSAQMGSCSSLASDSQPVHEPPLAGSLSEKTPHEKTAGSGHSENSESRAGGVPFDICPVRSGTGVTLKAPLHVQNKIKRNEAKRTQEGPGISVLRSGMLLLRRYISLNDQIKIVKACRDLGLGSGGFYEPAYRDGGKLHLKMMCLGKNWDPETSQYGDRRPVDEAKPPAIPTEFYRLVTGAIQASHSYLRENTKLPDVEEVLPSVSPNICIVNFYTKTGRLGLHQDKDESKSSLNRGLPVVSFSIGDSAEFLYGDQGDTDKAAKVTLESGDVLIFGGASRLIYHGVAAIVPDTAPRALLDETKLLPGRLNLTFREY